VTKRSRLVSLQSSQISSARQAFWLHRVSRFPYNFDMSIARQRVEDATTRTSDELSRRLRESIRSAPPRSGGIIGPELENYLSVIAPVVGDFVREMRSADAKIIDRLEHLRRRVELLDICTRNQPEPRKVLRRVQQLEIAVAVMRAGRKGGTMHRAGATAARAPELRSWRCCHQ